MGTGGRSPAERNAKASGIASSPTRAVPTSAATQPRFVIAAWVVGASINWPADPPALTIPNATARRSIGTRRPTSASNSEFPATALPAAAIATIATLIVTTVLVASNETVATASATAPAAIVRNVP